MSKLLLVLLYLALIRVQFCVGVIFHPLDNDFLVIIMLDFSTFAHTHVVRVKFGVALGGSSLFKYIIGNISAWYGHKTCWICCGRHHSAITYQMLLIAS